MSLIKVSDLTKTQKSVVESVPRGIKWLHGPAGTGKTTVGVRRMLRLLSKDKVFANQILVVVPQPVLGLPYKIAARDPKLEAGGRITITTLGSLAQDAVKLFAPLVMPELGFANPYAAPTFLSLETALYHMSEVAGQIIAERGYFDTVTIARNRLYSQIIDNLNKAAVVGFPHEQIATRLIAAWGDKDPGQVTLYQHAQDCAEAFRQHCLQHNLIDFSLRVEMFRLLWQMPPVRAHFVQKYRHLIIENAEEDTPVTHDILLDWLPEAESGLIITDSDGGFRRFLGAAPNSAARLTQGLNARDKIVFTAADSFVTPPALQALTADFATSLNQAVPIAPMDDPRAALGHDTARYYTEMVRNTVNHIADLIHGQGVPAGEIVLLAPFISDGLRFFFAEELSKQGITLQSHRPSRALREEPTAAALLTWAQLAHPHWQMTPSSQEVVQALRLTLPELDPVRAQFALLQLYKGGRLGAFDALPPGVQERISYRIGAGLQTITTWLEAYQANPLDELDLFWSRLFEEVLARTRYGLVDDSPLATVAANLIDSARNFRQAMGEIPLRRALGHEYVRMVRGGVLADQYLRTWETPPDDHVLMLPAYTFLMMNRPVQYQVWLNLGSSGWWERLYQPLTHPYVLTREWDANISGQVWTDDDEYSTRNETLYRLLLGLVRRCRTGIYL
ncbi:MAG: UvrD-helicase domain-containing protein, partial [Phototrophicaceae bacterium]